MNTPNIVVSKCLGFAKCRWNGITIPNDFVEKLKKHVNFIPVCPEVEIGLGVPRDPLRIVNKRLTQPKSGNDFTPQMQKFSEKYLKSLKNIDGFILKYKSPSCSPKNGLFAKEVLNKFPGLAVEDEGRLRNFKIREHFLTKIYALAEFRSVKTPKDLVEFQTRNRLLLMAYSQKEMKVLGKIAADANPTAKEEYKKHLLLALGKIPRYTSNINVLMHAYNHFSKKLNADEKRFFQKLIREYKEEKIPLSAITVLIQDWILRFNDDYLAKQTFFKPHPEELIDITDSGKGRDR